MDSKSPVRVYPFHADYPGLPSLFHVACDEHPDLGFCGERVAADNMAALHIEGYHSELVSR